MTKKANIAVTAVFIFFIAVFFVLNFITPDIEFSERENRFLQTLPEFSFADLFSGEYISDFETYSTDQFPGRDAWTTFKAAMELALGKQENNGVLLCDNDTLIEPFHAPGADVIEKNMTAVNKLANGTDVPVYFGLVPGKSAVLSDLMPENIPGDLQTDLIASAYALSEAQNVDIYSALIAHSDEYVFYRTDHHWTTLGAYYGYAALAESMGYEPLPLSAYTAEVVSDKFYGTTYSSSGFSWIAPDSITRYVEASDELTITNYLTGTPEAGVLYDESYLAKKDKYSMFFGGNTPLLQIATGNTDGERVLILRDSYTDSMAGYFFPHVSELHMIDLRYYKASILQYIADNAIDRVVVLYSVDNFATDSNLFLMGR